MTENCSGRGFFRRGSSALVIAALAILMAGPAQASGITLARFGGIFGHANADSGLALYWNPARLSVAPGLFLTLDGTFIYRIASYDRVLDDPDNATLDEIAVNSGETSVSTNGVLPYFAAGYAYEGSGYNLGFGLGIYTPFGGVSNWGKNLDAPSEYPGAIDGPQRWSAIASNFIILNYTVGTSLTLTDLGLSFGGTFSFVDATLDTVKARNLNRTDHLIDSDGYLLEGRAHFAGADQAATFAVGASYEDDVVTASLTYRHGFTLQLSGPIRQAYATSTPTQVDGYTDFPLPHIFLTAFSLHLGSWTVTALSDFSTWSRIAQNDVLSVATDEQLLSIPRDLNDTLTLRGMLGYDVSDTVNLAFTVGFDPSAVPTQTIDASLADSDKVVLGLGAAMAFGAMDVLLSYHHELWFEQVVTDNVHQPTNNGTFQDTRGYLNLSFTGHF